MLENGYLIDKHGNERVMCNVLCAVTGVQLSNIILSLIWNSILEKFGPFSCFVAGAISSAIATPTDVLKVRMQVHGRGTEQIGLIGCFREIYQYEGIRGLWRVRRYTNYTSKRTIHWIAAMISC